MTKPDAEMKLINPTDAPLTPQAQVAITALAARQSKANGVLMKVISYTGTQVEDGLSMLPVAVRTRIDGAARQALEHSYRAASRTRSDGALAKITGDRAHKALATVSGALGGLGGLPTALAELPIATTVIFRAVQDVAQSYGEDPTSAETRLECLRVFGSGGPGDADDGVDTTFVGARISLTGPALSGLLNKIAPRFAAVLGQKLASQAIPVIGAAAGAGTNYAFTDYYVEMAHVHFGLRQQIRAHGESQVLDRFHLATLDQNPPINRA